jgi:hypothetical protein
MPGCLDDAQADIGPQVLPVAGNLAGPLYSSHQPRTPLTVGATALTTRFEHARLLGMIVSAAHGCSRRRARGKLENPLLQGVSWQLKLCPRCFDELRVAGP